MNRIPHTVIRASAGSGKTYQLAHRYIQLLARHEKADRIVALTFSRKAAGEIFEKIMEQLCCAASDENVAADMAKKFERRDLRSDCFRDMLVRVIEKLHRLQIGTIDSFTVRVVQAFPLELGMSLDLSMMDGDGATAAMVRDSVLGRILAGREVSEQDKARFVESFKLATFGREEKSPGRMLDDFIQESHQDYRVLPSAEAWGIKAVIWPDGFPWKVLDEGGAKVALHAARSALETLGGSSSVLKAWKKAAKRALKRAKPSDADNFKLRFLSHKYIIQ